MKVTELITDIDGRLWRKAGVDGEAYVKLTERVASKLMAKGCVINAGKIIAYGVEFINCDSSKVALTEEQLMIVAAGKCKIVRNIEKYPVKLKYHGGNIDIDTSGQILSGPETGIEGSVRIGLIHRMLESTTDICKEAGEMSISICSRHGAVYLCKSRTRLNCEDTDKLDNYKIDIIKKYRPVDRSIENTINRWNCDIKEGRLVIYSNEDVELFIEVDRNKVAKILKQINNMRTK